MPFIRKVRVLFKTRLIFPRINGPNDDDDDDDDEFDDGDCDNDDDAVMITMTTTTMMMMMRTIMVMLMVMAKKTTTTTMKMFLTLKPKLSKCPWHLPLVSTRANILCPSSSLPELKGKVKY